jgi:arylformamidase
MALLRYRRHRSLPEIIRHASRAGAATLLFFHDGYWQRNAKEGFSFVAEGPLDLGINVAVAGYTLAPEATMDAIVGEARTALHWLHRHLATLGGDRTRLYVSGWSAGGHLAAMLMSEPLVAGGLAISGLFDLEPIRLCYLNDKLGLDANQARRNSPLHNLPRRAANLIIAYGSEELPSCNANLANSGQPGVRGAFRARRSRWPIAIITPS